LRASGDQRQRGLLARRSRHAPTAIASFVASGPQQLPLDELARVVGTRGAGAERVEPAKGEGGLDHDEVRSWPGW
jgi:hypothetical protein